MYLVLTYTGAAPGFSQDGCPFQDSRGRVTARGLIPPPPKKEDSNDIIKIGNGHYLCEILAFLKKMVTLGT